MQLIQRFTAQISLGTTLVKHFIYRYILSELRFTERLFSIRFAPCSLIKSMSSGRIHIVSLEAKGSNWLLF